MKKKIFESYFSGADEFTDELGPEETVAGTEDDRILADFKHQTFWYCCSYNSSFVLNTNKKEIVEKIAFLRKTIGILEMNRSVKNISEPIIMERCQKDKADDSEIVISDETLFTFPLVRLIGRCGKEIELDDICFAFGFTLVRKPFIKDIVRLINVMASLTDEGQPLGDNAYAIVSKHYGEHILMENWEQTEVEKLRELVIRCKYLLQYGTDEEYTYPEIIYGMKLSDTQTTKLFHAKYDNIFYTPNIDCGMFRVKSLPVEEYKTLIEKFVSNDKAIISYNIPYMDIKEVDRQFLDEPSGYHPYRDEFFIIFGIDEAFGTRNCMYICYNERREDSAAPAHVKMIFHMGDRHCENSQYEAAAMFLSACGMTLKDVEAARKQFVTESEGNKQKMLTILKKEIKKLKNS